MSVGTKIAKTIGAVALGVTAYDSVKMSHRNAVRNTYAQEADYLTDVFLDHQSSGTMSPSREGVKRWWRNSILESSITKTSRGLINTAVSAVKQLADSIVPIALGLTALFVTKSGSKARTIVGGVAAGMLALQGFKLVLFDTIGIGKRSKL